MIGRTDYFLSFKALQGGAVRFGDGKKGYILSVRKIKKNH